MNAAAPLLVVAARGMNEGFDVFAPNHITLSQYILGTVYIESFLSRTLLGVVDPCTVICTFFCLLLFILLIQTPVSSITGFMYPIR